MIIRLIILFTFMSTFCSAQKYLHIYGKIQPKSSDSVSLYAYNSSFSHISGNKKMVYTTTLDADGNYKINIPWNETQEINLLNGDKYIVFNIFLSRGDSVEITQVEDEFSTNGKGSENIEYSFRFADKFYIDSSIRAEYANSYGSKNISQFHDYILRRRDQQLLFLEDFSYKNNLKPAVYESERANIYYKYVVDKTQYLWKHNYANKKQGFLAVDSSYFSFLQDIKVSKNQAEKSHYYYYFLHEYIDALWTMQISKLPDSVQKQKYAAQYLEKIELAEEKLVGKEKELAIAAIISRAIQNNDSGDSSIWQLFLKLKKNGIDKELYNSLLAEYNAVNSLSGKPAPIFTAITQNGEKFELASLKGKVVLLDIWSTTCGPCLKNIPESVKLKNELKDKPFETLNLCMSSSEESWKKLVIAGKWNGIHIFSKNDAELYNNYRFKGFPQYILIDKNGNIVKLNADKPGSEHLKQEILKLLAD
ncbi:MAG: TlpA family protein disulfide reductase [Sphingobacteriales bacterium]|nr:MAG: TlpA family protein disulfide reductase [Sphingobacteriales bacterium]